MPAEQRGQVYKTSGSYGLRWYDENGKRKRKAGFSSRSKALAWFRAVDRPRMRGETPQADRTITFREHVDHYLDAHAVGRDPFTIRTLRHRLGYATATFGDLSLEELERTVPEIAAWVGILREKSRYGIVQALRQALEAAVRWGHMTRNPAKLAGPNPQPKAEEIHPFTQAEIGSRRRAPLSTRALEALDAVPRRLDVRLVFPGQRGEVIDLKNFRRSQWHPALASTGIEPRRIYDMRHSFATWALDAGLSIFDLSRFMGTSVEMIDRTYGHLAQGAEQSAQAKLDAAYARRTKEATTEVR